MSETDAGRAIAAEIDGLTAKILELLTTHRERVAVSALAASVASWVAATPPEHRAETLRDWFSLLQELIGHEMWKAATTPTLN